MKEKVNTNILRLAIMAFSFSMLCLGLKGGNIPILPWAQQYTFSTPTVILQVIGYTSLAATVGLLVAAFCRGLRECLQLDAIMSDIETPNDTSWIAGMRTIKWMITFLVVFGAWVGGLAKIVEVSQVAFWIIYFFGLILLGVVFWMLLRTWRTKRQNIKNRQMVVGLWLWLVFALVVALWAGFDYASNEGGINSGMCFNVFYGTNLLGWVVFFLVFRLVGYMRNHQITK